MTDLQTNLHKSRLTAVIHLQKKVKFYNNDIEDYNPK